MHQILHDLLKLPKGLILSIQTHPVVLVTVVTRKPNELYYRLPEITSYYPVSVRQILSALVILPHQSFVQKIVILWSRNQDPKYPVPF